MDGACYFDEDGYYHDKSSIVSESNTIKHEINRIEKQIKNIVEVNRLGSLLPGNIEPFDINEIYRMPRIIALNTQLEDLKKQLSELPISIRLIRRYELFEGYYVYNR